jgi:hypothetical protein
MTTPREEQPPAQPATGPTVSTAPPRSRWGWSRVPTHVGPARTSTVIIALLFVGVFALYLVVRPQPTTVATTGAGGGAQPTQVQQTPTRTTTPAPTTARTTTPAHTTAGTSSAGTSTEETTPSTSGGSSETPGGTSGSPTTTPLVPTTGAAPSS